MTDALCQNEVHPKQKQQSLPRLPKYVRLFLYSFIPNRTLFLKLALLSKSERANIQSSKLVGKRKLSIKLSGVMEGSNYRVDS